jgi:hypothetical protein
MLCQELSYRQNVARLATLSRMAATVDDRVRAVLERLRSLREARELSQEAVGRTFGKNRVDVYKIEKGITPLTVERFLSDG